MTANSQSAAPTAQVAKVSPEQYSEAVESARLVSIRLIKSEFVVEPEALGRDRSSWKHGYDCKSTASSFDATRKLLTGLVVADASCKIGRKRIVWLKCRYLIAYSIDGAPTEEAATSFVRRVSVFAAYPYFRSHFSESCSQAGIALPPLPVLKEPRQKIAKVRSKATS